MKRAITAMAMLWTAGFPIVIESLNLMALNEPSNGNVVPVNPLSLIWWAFWLMCFGFGLIVLGGCVVLWVGSEFPEKQDKRNISEDEYEGRIKKANT